MLQTVCEHAVTMGTLKLQNNNGPLYCSNTVIGTLAVDGWAVTFQMQQPTHQRPVYERTSYYLMWHYNINC